MQLLKQIWNERRSNGWLWSELLIVFVVLWYVVDWTYVTARTYYEPVGFDITDTYYLVSIPDEELAKLKTVGDIYNYITAHI